MDKDELDFEINELDHRLDRLRSLYEQYFLGIERIEPAVARKDVDRRFWALRKIKIRNTARRFKLQTLIQRYNTFQQHWARICREIENGTYKRQLLRAERRQGPASTHVRDNVLPPNSEGADAARAAAEADLESLLDGDVDLAAEAKRALDAVLQSKPPPPRFKPDEAPTQPRAAMRSVAPLEKLELDDFDLDGPASKPPPRAPPSRALPSRGISSATSADATAAEKPSQAPRPALPLTRPPLPSRPSGAADPASRPSAAPVARVALKKVAVPARSITELAGAARESVRPAVASTQVAASPPAQTAAPTGVAARPAARPFRSAIGGSGRAADIFGASTSAPPATATTRTPAALAKPAASAAKPAASAAAQPRAGLTEDRVKQLHAKLVATKSQLNDRGEVSVGGLQRQLAASYEKLQTKHRGRQIDFDVVVKDGKAVLKPKIR